MAFKIKVHIKIKKTYPLKASTNFSGVPPERAKLAKAPSPGMTRQANAPQLPGGGRAQLELTDA